MLEHVSQQLNSTDNLMLSLLLSFHFFPLYPFVPSNNKGHLGQQTGRNYFERFKQAQTRWNILWLQSTKYKQLFMNRSHVYTTLMN